MARPKGSSKTGGRKKGTPNKSTLARQQEFAAGGELPRDYMLRIMRDPEADDHRRDEMAKAVAPYIHPRLSRRTSQTPTTTKHIFPRWISCASSARATACSMAVNRLSVRPRRRFIATTDSDHDGPVFPNLAKNIVPTNLNQLWVADITYIAIATGSSISPRS